MTNNKKLINRRKVNFVLSGGSLSIFMQVSVDSLLKKLLREGFI